MGTLMFLYEPLDWIAHARGLCIRFCRCNRQSLTVPAPTPTPTKNPRKRGGQGR